MCAIVFTNTQATRPVTSSFVCESWSVRERCSGGVHTRLIYVNSAAYVYTRRLYLCTHRPTAVGRASFVECGLILMGTDDKQRKQASSLPGEICLLLPGVQWGPIHAYTSTSTTTDRMATTTTTTTKMSTCSSGLTLRTKVLGSVGHTRPSSRRVVPRSFIRHAHTRARSSRTRIDDFYTHRCLQMREN